MDYVIGCDVGSQSTKVLLLTLEGQVAGEAAAGYTIDYPQPVWAEQPVARWTDAFQQATRQLLAETGVAPGRIRALGLASQVEGVVPVNAGGQALRPAIIWMDRRAEAQCQRVREAAGEAAVFDLTGLNLDPSHVAPKMRWIADHEPKLFARTARLHMPGSYMGLYLTGETAVDYSIASATLLLDIRAREWSSFMCAQFDLDIGLLPPLRPATAPLGRLRASVAEAVGLRPDTLVVTGSGDEHAACLGAGVVGAGLIGDIAGTSEPVCAAVAAPAFDPTRLVETHCHADPALWLLENPGFVSGANYRWLRDQFGADETRAGAAGGPSAYARLDALAEAVPPGAEGLIFLPSLMGATSPTWNEAARGAFAGFTLAHTRAHFTRAVLEGSAYAVRAITDQLQSLGLAPREMRVMGGGAKSALWNQIKADVTGLPVGVPQATETTALGAALLALVGCGAYASLAKACPRVVKIQQHFEPRPQTQAAYADAYGRFRRVYSALEPVG
ncbi:MAG: FGGY family carbohydrate kinase [Anaerolineales bacterium]